MTRIIAGRAGGRRLATPPGAATRPTTDRVREAVFSRLDHLGVLAGASVLDLYAGSGALGLEAVSRGAATATLVERARRVADVARRNAAAVGAGDVTVVAQAVTGALAGPLPGAPFDVVLLDPPYDIGEAEVTRVLAALVEPGLLAPGAVVVVERSTRSPEPTWPGALSPLADRAYGETRVWYAEPTPG